MAIEIDKLVAAISPDVYCAPDVRKEVKKIVKEELQKGVTEAKKAYLKAAEKAKPNITGILFNYDEANKEPFALWGFKGPIAKHEIDFDSTTEGLEPLYFWTLQYIERAFVGVDKITDNFVSSPGSGHFSELMGKATRMQEEAMKILGTVNTVIKSILNIIYDLKEFKIRLEVYRDLKSEDPATRSSALLSLKQIWLDNVDIKRGSTSIKQLGISGLNQPNFVTLIDAFMTVKSLDHVKDLDLNERVKRILEQRVGEFFRWIKESEKELSKRFSIEKKYLQTQVNTVKLYSRWVKPYLKAAKKLEQEEYPHESLATGLVTAFNTIIFDLTLLAYDEYNPVDDVNVGTLPKIYETVKIRKYIPLVLVEFMFRGIPHRTGQHYTFGGRTKIKFTSYALSDQEIKVLKKSLEEDDFGDIMKLIEGATTESLDEIEKDIDELLAEETPEEIEKKKKEKFEDVNPFTALFSFGKKDKAKGKKEKEEDLSKEIKTDIYLEKVVRSQAIIKARNKGFDLFNTFKKAHKMPAHYDPYRAI